METRLVRKIVVGATHIVYLSERFGRRCHSFYLFCLIQSHTFITTFVLHSHYIRRDLSPFIALSLSGKNLPGVPSREFNSGLPYSRPSRYQLSYAAPYRVTLRPTELHCALLSYAAPF
jgi:hypothetical protein